jgi:imidazolonepropionase-like amidohydrolase
MELTETSDHVVETPIQELAMKPLAITLAMMGWCSVAIAQDDPARTLFTNVHVFDGVSAERIENANVLVEGNLINAVSTDPIDAGGATVIDWGGRTLMPGLSDTHTHLAYSSISQMRMLTGHASYDYIRATVDAEGMLMRGITSVRDMGGNVFGLKSAIDEGLELEFPRFRGQLASSGS